SLVDSLGKTIFSAKLVPVKDGSSWFPGEYFYRADFSSFNKAGHYKVSIATNNEPVLSASFEIASQALARLTLPSIIQYYHKQRANTPQEQEADQHVLLYGSTETADVRGGWCDASGDVSKYFSHLAYTNVMLPQQIPLVTWSMANAKEKITPLLDQLGSTNALEAEALWGADYLMRSLSSKGYFYMTVFSYFKPDPHARRIVGLLANSVTTPDYQCAFREGGGMAIAALARISRWNRNGDFTAAQYLQAARLAFDHLLKNSTRYADDGKDNILDDYCALMAASELWMATGEKLYQQEARKRATNLCKRMTPQGYFIANDKNRPFWHAADAGLPIVALERYLKIESDASFKKPVLTT
ncbi:MAG: glycosyl transferase, partial [Moraxellaceae bacterium]